MKDLTSAIRNSYLSAALYAVLVIDGGCDVLKHNSLRDASIAEPALEDRMDEIKSFVRYQGSVLGFLISV